MFNWVNTNMDYADWLYFQRWLADNSDNNSDSRKFSGSVLRRKDFQEERTEQPQVIPAFEKSLKNIVFILNTVNWNKQDCY